MMQRKWRRFVSAFSLMEVMFALGMMSVALLTLVSVLVTGLRAERSSEQRASARNFGNQVLGRSMAELRELSDTEAAKFWNQDYSPPGAAWKSGNGKHGNFSFSYEIHAQTLQNRVTGQAFGQANGITTNGLKKVDVTVRWDGTGTTEAENSTSLVVTRLINRKS
jgi:uncharacterized protein (TIGR02598 family)